MISIGKRIVSIVPVLGLACAACGDNGSGDPGVDAAPGDDAGPDAPPAPAPGITFADFDIAVDLTPDGRTAVFEDFEGVAARMYFVDTATGTAVDQGIIGDATRVFATGVSSDRKVSSLHAEPVQAAVWSEAGGWIDLGTPHVTGCDQDLSSAWDISADGQTVVGMAWNGCNPDAFRWSGGAFTPLQVLGAPLGGAALPTNRATVISDDGTTTGGFASTAIVDRSAVLWRANGTGFLLFDAASDAPSEVLSISADGATAAGNWGFDGFVWTQATGPVIMQRFDLALPSDPVFPNAITADGQFVFGAVGSEFFGLPQAFVWSSDDGMRVLADVARGAGIDIAATTILTNVMAASADGTLLTGFALEEDGTRRSFVLVLPAGGL